MFHFALRGIWHIARSFCLCGVPQGAYKHPLSHGCVLLQPLLTRLFSTLLRSSDPSMFAFAFFLLRALPWNYFPAPTRCVASVVGDAAWYRKLLFPVSSCLWGNRSGLVVLQFFGDPFWNGSLVKSAFLAALILPLFFYSRSHCPGGGLWLPALNVRFRVSDIPCLCIQVWMYSYPSCIRMWCPTATAIYSLNPMREGGFSRALVAAKSRFCRDGNSLRDPLMPRRIVFRNGRTCRCGLVAIVRSFVLFTTVFLLVTP